MKAKPEWNERFFVEGVVNYTPAHPYFKKYFDKPARRTPYNRFREMDYERFGFARAKNHMYDGGHQSPQYRSGSQDEFYQDGVNIART